VITFRLDPRSGLSPYQQLVRQVRQEVQLGTLRAGDQLPTVREVVANLAINPNTVQKAYRELEQAGVVAGRPGIGTFVVASVPGPSPSSRAALDRSLQRWLRSAFDAGLDHDGVIAVFEANLRGLAREGVA
jgi:GntR family transcriptional regulator